MSLADLFPDSEYQFHMGLNRGSVAEFFGPSAERERLLQERRHWLRTTPRLCAALLPEGSPILEESIELAHSLGNLAPAPLLPASANQDAWERCRVLGEVWEPDFLLLKADGDGQIRLFGGCVCFPSSWRLSEKIGKPIESIHGVVPGLNEQIGRRIHTFLDRIKPGVAWLRTNWGLSRSPELNQHPDRSLPRLDESAALDAVWVRVEHQALVALPGSSGILFGIRLALHPLAQAKADPVARRGLVRALTTMSEPVAEYKGLAAARAKLVQLLEDSELSQADQV